MTEAYAYVTQDVQDGRQKNAKMIFSLSVTINHKKKHVGKNYANNHTKLYKGVLCRWHIREVK